MSSHKATVKRDLLISVDECAELLQLAPQTIRDLVETGTWIGSQKVNKTYLIPRRPFERLYLEGDVRELATEPVNPFLRRLAS